MRCLGVKSGPDVEGASFQPATWAQAGAAQHSSQRVVARRRYRGQFGELIGSGKFHQLAGQRGAHSPSLPGVFHHQRDLGGSGSSADQVGQSDRGTAIGGHGEHAGGAVSADQLHQHIGRQSGSGGQ
nr:hypothetical protein [uncultured bacterium]